MMMMVVSRVLKTGLSRYIKYDDYGSTISFHHGDRFATAIRYDYITSLIG